MEHTVGPRVLMCVIRCQKIQIRCYGLLPFWPSRICQVYPYFCWEHRVEAALPTPPPLPRDDSN